MHSGGDTLTEREIRYSEELEKELEDFVSQKNKIVTPNLLLIIKDIAVTGLTCYPWQHLKQLLATQLSKVLDELNAKSPLADFNTQKQKLVEGLQNFPGVPFTIQRICELLINPTYPTTRKYVFAFEKLLTITSTQETLSPQEYNEAVALQTLSMYSLRHSVAAKEEPSHHKDEHLINVMDTKNAINLDLLLDRPNPLMTPNESIPPFPERHNLNRDIVSTTLPTTAITPMPSSFPPPTTSTNNNTLSDTATENTSDTGRNDGSKSSVSVAGGSDTSRLSQPATFETVAISASNATPSQRPSNSPATATTTVTATSVSASTFGPQSAEFPSSLFSTTVAVAPQHGPGSSAEQSTEMATSATASSSSARDSQNPLESQLLLTSMKPMEIEPSS
jgi:hypothetical protein